MSRGTSSPPLTLSRPGNLTSRQNVSGDAAHADQQVSVTLEFCAHHDHNPLAGTASLRQGMGQKLRRPSFLINCCLPIRTMFKGSRVGICKSCMRVILSQNSCCQICRMPQAFEMLMCRSRRRAVSDYIMSLETCRLCVCVPSVVSRARPLVTRARRACDACILGPTSLMDSGRGITKVVDCLHCLYTSFVIFANSLMDSGRGIAKVVDCLHFL